MDFNKYNPLQKPEAPLLTIGVVEMTTPAAPPLSWRDNEKIRKLLHHMKKCVPHGISLTVNFSLVFDPGLRKDDHERSVLARQAWDLLVDAEPDLRDLRAKGIIKSLADLKIGEEEPEQSLSCETQALFDEAGPP